MKRLFLSVLAVTVILFVIILILIGLNRITNDKPVGYTAHLYRQDSLFDWDVDSVEFSHHKEVELSRIRGRIHLSLAFGKSYTNIYAGFKVTLVDVIFNLGDPYEAYAILYVEPVP